MILRGGHSDSLCHCPNSNSSLRLSSPIRRYSCILMFMIMFATIFLVLELTTIGNEYLQPSVSKDIINIYDGNERVSPWNSSRISTNDEEINKSETEPYSDDEKYITYLPHSGVHNQRISLQNAVTIAHLLNRTLILPPLILGSRFSYASFNVLSKKLAELSVEQSRDVCANLIAKDKREGKEERTRKKMIYKECKKFHDSYTLYRWDELFDFEFVRQHVKILHRKDFNDTRLYKLLNIKDINSGSVHYIKTSPTSHRFFEYAPEKPLANVRIDLLSDLRDSNAKLIYVSSLYGPGRINCQLPSSCEFIKKLQKFVPKHPVVNKVVNAIVKELGGRFKFMGVHARVGDGHFWRDRDKRVAKLMKNIMAGLKKESRNNNGTIAIKTRMQEECIRRFPGNDGARKVIYLSTDASPNSPTIKPLIKAFPCIHMLSDFSKQLAPLRKLRNRRGDNKILAKFLMPVVDLMVAANGGQVHTLSRSTFGTYLRMYHKLLVKSARSKKKT